MWSEDEKKANPTRHGFVRVHANEPRAGRCFEYADGTPFLWIGDTWWNWTQRGIHFETFRNLVDDRAKKGFNVGQLFFAANGWGRRSSLLDADYNEPDIGHIQSIERCIAQRYDGSENCKNPGRPKISQEITGLVIRFKKENPHWGYTRIRDYTVHLGYKIGETTVKNILIENGYDPKPDLTRKTTWKEFIKSHWNVLAACDFFSIELFVKGKLVRCMVLFAVDAATRKVEILGLPAQPNGAWMAQIARNVSGDGGFLTGKKHLIHDRDPLYTAKFESILKAAGVEPVKLPPRSPNLNAHAERFVRSVKEECLGHLILFSEEQLRYVLTEYLKHYHHERIHQGINEIIEPQDEGNQGEIICIERLGGLLRSYHRKAA